MRDRSWVARRECPPSTKKLSWTPICSTPRRSDQMAAICCSPGVRGVRKGTSSLGRDRSGGGRARRSVLPLGVRGKVVSHTNVVGTRASGSVFLRKLRSSWHRGSLLLGRHHISDQTLSLQRLPRHVVTTASCTAGCWLEDRLDFAEFDTDATDLYLVVKAPEKFESTVRQGSAPDLRSYKVVLSAQC